MESAKSRTGAKKAGRVSRIAERRRTPARDRRRHPRLHLKLPMNYSRKELKAYYGGIVGNASEGGILVYLPEKLNSGEVLKIEILFAKGWELKTVRGMAKIIWSDLAVRKSRKIHRYGLQFQLFNKRNIQKLRILLKERVRNEKE